VDDQFGLNEALLDPYSVRGNFALDVAADAVGGSAVHRFGAAYMDVSVTQVWRVRVDGVRHATPERADGVFSGSMARAALPLNVGLNAARGVYRGVNLPLEGTASGAGRSEIEWPAYGSLDGRDMPIYLRFEHLFEGGEGPFASVSDVSVNALLVGNGTGLDALRGGVRALVEVSLPGTALRAVHAERRHRWNVSGRSTRLPAFGQRGGPKRDGGVRGSGDTPRGQEMDGRGGKPLQLRPREVRAVASTGYEHNV
jgi:hypothetical protein